jgi:hypothetical protein
MVTSQAPNILVPKAASPVGKIISLITDAVNCSGKLLPGLARGAHVIASKVRRNN